MAEDVLHRLKRSMLELNMDTALESVRSVAEGFAGVTARDAVEAVSESLQVVGQRFQEGEWFVSELVYASEIAKEAMNVLMPLMDAGAFAALGKIVVGTVSGDMHDLGKNIFASYAKVAGFEVIDLGVDVAKEKFADAVGEHHPLALGLSCLLTLTAGQVGQVIEELHRRGLRREVKVVVGGAALTERFATEVGADAFAPDAVSGTQIVRVWSES
jgi:methylmalonyl-CoA mutase cobalamin-binding domain/chain